MRKRIIIASGGTGGHFYPGFAVAREMEKRGWQVLFVVKKNDISAGALKEKDYPFLEIDVSPFGRGFNLFGHASFYFRLSSAVKFLGKVLKDFGPSACASFGAYVSFPLLAAARMSKVPAFLHESNAAFGLSNRLGGHFCREIFLGLPVKNNPFARKSLVTGTPVREIFAKEISPAAARRKFNLRDGAPVVLVAGGSQGAVALNSAAVKAARALWKKGMKFQLIHLAGRGNYEKTRGEYARAGLMDSPALRLFDYRDDMREIYAASDLAVTRAGASTVAELAVLSKPALLVPFPFASANHQFLNAKILEKAGCAEIVLQGENFERELEERIARLLGGAAAEMKAAFRKLELPDMRLAAAKIAGEIVKGGHSYGESADNLP